MCNSSLPHDVIDGFNKRRPTGWRTCRSRIEGICDERIASQPGTLSFGTELHQWGAKLFEVRVFILGYNHPTTSNNIRPTTLWQKHTAERKPPFSTISLHATSRLGQGFIVNGKYLLPLFRCVSIVYFHVCRLTEHGSPLAVACLSRFFMASPLTLHVHTVQSLYYTVRTERESQSGSLTARMMMVMTTSRVDGVRELNWILCVYRLPRVNHLERLKIFITGLVLAANANARGIPLVAQRTRQRRRQVYTDFSRQYRIYSFFIVHKTLQYLLLLPIFFHFILLK